MPRLIVTEGAAVGLRRCRDFLADKSEEAATRAGQTIERHFMMLETNPDIGRPLATAPLLRELIIPFGIGGYVALYRHEPTNDVVIILAFRHQREVGY